MKKILLSLALLSVVACTKESLDEVGNQTTLPENQIVGSEELAAKGFLRVKLSQEMASKVLAVQSTRSEEGRSGVGEIDGVLDQIEAQNFRRVVEYDPEWEADFEATGLNRWYCFEFDENSELGRVAKMVAGVQGVERVEMVIDHKYMRVMSEGPAVPLSESDLEGVNPSTRAGVAMNDPLFEGQWHFNNMGYTDEKSAVPGADINLVDAWSLCSGENNGTDVVVAVIDEPIYTEHPDLKDNMWCNPQNPEQHGYNFYNKTSKLDWKSSARTQDQYGRIVHIYADHGSHVGGVIAAVNNNGVGVCGVAGGKGKGGNVKLMSCQIMGYSNVNANNNADIDAFVFALKNGAVIAQNSWGFNYNNKLSNWEAIKSEWEAGRFGALQDAIQTFVKSAGTKNPNSPIKGGLVIFAAGNDGHWLKDRICYPAGDQSHGVIAVGAMDWSYLPSFYTNYGTWVDITAPGGDFMSNKSQVLSTILCDDSMSYDDNRKKNTKTYGYGYQAGTSMACPHVSGVAALGLAYAAKIGRQFTTQEYRDLLLSSVYGIDRYFTGVKVPGNGLMLNMADYKGKMGGGCVDALKLLLAIKGTPGICVKTGEEITQDLAPYLGGAHSTIKIKSIESSDFAKLGLEGAPKVSGSKWTLNCPKEGMALVQVKAVAGDTEITREIALISRKNVAQNGGLL